MKIAIKKVQCPKCGKLVRTREQVTSETTQLLCTQCGQVIWVWDGIKWLQKKPE